MAWNNEIISIVRVLINDMTSPYAYSDERLLQTIVVAAKYVQFDVVLDHFYEINVTSPSIAAFVLKLLWSIIHAVFKLTKLILEQKPQWKVLEQP